MSFIEHSLQSRKGSSTLSDTVVAAVADSEVTKELKHTQDELEMTKKGIVHLPLND